MIPSGVRPPWMTYDIDELIIMGIPYLGQMPLPVEKTLDTTYLPESLVGMANNPLPFTLEIIASKRVKKCLRMPKDDMK